MSEVLLAMSTSNSSVASCLPEFLLYLLLSFIAEELSMSFLPPVLLIFR